LEGIIYLQLLKIVVILPLRNGGIQVIGLLVVAVGIWICFVARKELGSNWSHAADYQIKKTHQLVTTGMYRYIRHPIYFGLALSWIGGEMVAGSYLFVSLFGIFVAFYVQGKREENNFLRSRFGKEYKEYMKKTKMLIPFIL
jgi:protein-S-isoprenylcysteine O-methyltransferase